MSLVNSSPQTFENVKVFSSDPWVEAADAAYQNLCFENIEEETPNIGEFRRDTNYAIHVSAVCKKLSVLIIVQ